MKKKTLPSDSLLTWAAVGRWLTAIASGEPSSGTGQVRESGVQSRLVNSTQLLGRQNWVTATTWGHASQSPPPIGLHSPLEYPHPFSFPLWTSCSRSASEDFHHPSLFP